MVNHANTVYGQAFIEKKRLLVEFFGRLKNFLKTFLWNRFLELSKANEKHCSCPTSLPVLVKKQFWFSLYRTKVRL